MLPGGDPGIHFDGQFGVLPEGKPGPERGHEVSQLIRAEVGGRPPSPLHLSDFYYTREEARNPAYLQLQVFQVLLGHRHVGRDHHMAATEQAPVFAEGEVRIEAQRDFGSLGIRRLEMRP